MSSQGPEGVEAGDKVPDAPEESALGARLGGGEGEEEEGGEEGGDEGTGGDFLLVPVHADPHALLDIRGRHLGRGG